MLPAHDHHHDHDNHLRAGRLVGAREPHFRFRPFPAQQSHQALTRALINTMIEHVSVTSPPPPTIAPKPCGMRFQRDKHPPRVRALGELRSGQIG